jgi:hypothetical protein
MNDELEGNYRVILALLSGNLSEGTEQIYEKFQRRYALGVPPKVKSNISRIRVKSVAAKPTRPVIML